MATSPSFIPSITTNTPGIAIAGYNITSEGIKKNPLKGPLDALNENKFNKKSMKYPRNLMTDASRKHYVIFSLYEPLAKEPTGAGITSISATKESAVEVARLGKDLVTPLIEGVSDIAGKVWNGDLSTAGAKIVKEIGSATQKLTTARLNENCYATIALYTPDNMGLQQTVNYDDVSATSALGTAYFLGQAGVSITDKFKQMVASGGVTSEKLINLIGNDPYLATEFGKTIESQSNKFGTGPGVTQLLLNRIGQAINPQVQVIFRQTDLRTFQFDFTLTPYSPEEADSIKEIVKTFRMAAAPQVQPNSTFGTGIFFNVPHQFDITFMYEGEENQNVNKIARCVATSVGVNYAPMGWMTFDQGVPVQTKLSLQFKEIELIDRNRINEGY